MIRPTVILIGSRAEQLRAEAKGIVGHAIVVMDVPYGDAARRGFDQAIAGGCTHAVVFDTDRHGTLVDLPRFVERVTRGPTAIVSGVRPRASLPKGVRFARGNCDFWTWVETRRWVTDSPLGYRAYPIGAIKDIATGSRHAEFDVEILAKAIWAGATVEPLALTATPADEPRMMPLAEAARFGWLTTRLVLQRLTLPAPLTKTINTKQFAASPVAWHVGRTLRDLALHRCRRPVAFALAVALGAPFGVVTLWRYQLVVALLVASLAKLSKGAVIGSAVLASLVMTGPVQDRVMASQIGGHPTGPLMLAIAVGILAGVTAYGLARALLRAQRTSDVRHA